MWKEWSFVHAFICEILLGVFPLTQEVQGEVPKKLYHLCRLIFFFRPRTVRACFATKKHSALQNVVYLSASSLANGQNHRLREGSTDNARCAPYIYLSVLSHLVRYPNIRGPRINANVHDTNMNKG